MSASDLGELSKMCFILKGQESYVRKRTRIPKKSEIMCCTAVERTMMRIHDKNMEGQRKLGEQKCYRIKKKLTSK